MSSSPDFFRDVFDAIPEQLAVIDSTGALQCVNHAWAESARSRGCTVLNWQKTNYLSICDAAANDGFDGSAVVANGIRDAIGNLDSFQHEYPCIFPGGEEWYSLTIRPINRENDNRFLISHHNITTGTLANKALEVQSRTDSLTGLSNRRHLDELLNGEWRRDMRSGTPLSVIMIDIDHFKVINDTYGHLAGDRCLRQIGKLIQSYAKRPGDHAARFGGEEFVLVLGDTTAEIAFTIATNLHEQIGQLNFPETPVTASLGVSTMVPARGTTEQVILAAADQSLYIAKNSGRNRVEAFGGG